jgi:hypothetical protein
MMIVHGWAAFGVTLAGATAVYGLGVWSGRMWQRAIDHIAWDRRRAQSYTETSGAAGDAEVSPGVRVLELTAEEGRAGPLLPTPFGPVRDRDDPRYYYPENQHMLRAERLRAAGVIRYSERERLAEVFDQHERDRHRAELPGRDRAGESPWLAEMLDRDTATWLAVANDKRETGNDRAERPK